MDLNKLNCMNYHVYDHVNDEYWYAQNGLRSLFEYSKISGSTFRTICEDLNNRGETTVHDMRPVCNIITERGALTITMI